MPRGKLIDSTFGLTFLATPKSGRTEKIVVNVIKKLFRGHEVKLLDHNDSTQSHYDLYCRVLKRLADLHVRPISFQRRIGYEIRELNGITLIKLYGI